MGAWIETEVEELSIEDIEVAPYVGAWIETVLTQSTQHGYTSRTLCGCVD